MGGPAFVGAFIGGFMGGKVSETILLSAAGLLVLWQGVELRMRGRAVASSDDFVTNYSGKRMVLGGGMGLAVGLLGGAVGLILGSIRLPALIRVLKVDPRIAAGTNLVIGFVMGSVGWIGHAIKGDVDYQLTPDTHGLWRRGGQLLWGQAHRQSRSRHAGWRDGLCASDGGRDPDLAGCDCLANRD